MHNSRFAAYGGLALAGSITLAAQTSPTARPQSPKPMPPAARRDQATMTVTGCLKAWDSRMGTAPADDGARPGTIAASSRYVLTDASRDTTKPDPNAGNVATTQAQPTQYILMAGPDTDLAEHVNHEVTVTGRVEHSRGGLPAMPHSDKPVPKPDEGTLTEAQGTDQVERHHTAGADHAWAILTVSSVTMLTATCTGTPKL